jgi:uracil-DNA glycosylase
MSQTVTLNQPHSFSPCQSPTEFHSMVSQGWSPFLSEEWEKTYFQNLLSFLRKECDENQVIFPPSTKIFRSLQLTDYHNVKVVILGQDPYHGLSQANGLAFAVENHIPPPPSLKNIFKELCHDLKISHSISPNLESWAKQGVLLLNTVLTVRQGNAFSHAKKGWETFTDHILKSLNEKNTPVIFMLWGAPAQSKASLITSPRHQIFRAPHPSPLSAYRGFFGCRHFSKANEFLKKHHLQPIQWDA